MAQVAVEVEGFDDPGLENNDMECHLAGGEGA